MTDITVNIVGGTEAENTTAVTIGNVRWGLNGTAPLGETQQVAQGLQDLVVFKTTNPNQISIKVDVTPGNVTLNITVDDDSINVQQV